MSCRFCGFFNPEHHDRELGDLCETCLGLVEYGVDREQARIIKLLETSELRWLNTFVATKEITARESFIALIKGENK